MKPYLNNFLFSLGLVSILFHHAKVHGETIKAILLSEANPPYTIRQNGEFGGIHIDIFSRLSALTEHTFTMLAYTPPRAVKEFDLGRVDVEPGINELWRQSSPVKALYSIAYASSTDLLVFKKQNRLAFSTPADLTGKTIGVIRSYAYPKYEDAFNSGAIKRVDGLSELHLLKLLQADRVKYIFIGAQSYYYHQKHHPQYREFEVGGVINQVEVKMRLHPNKAYLLPQLNDALGIMIRRGEIKAIYNKYQ
ncbi:substrate-binding periplasmic protein [Thalassomonas actiniarum]|uniref:Transporter substrate-binding domain-containing protein n=1 Tax=Thalassomonas actiniarum TaxID=485447 RepID=A0AAE9YPT1_9GAMM|nr:transporter substrate-binding domain-containing protein [Thalassomonas actiniarum]WDD97998.1 transporter substrate-binding domain-containing protein [Thalassomonas actiniarum]